MLNINISFDARLHYLFQTVICPTTALSGGPLISLEWSDNSKSLCIVWIPPEDFPVTDYWVYRDGIKCGKKVITFIQFHFT